MLRKTFICMCALFLFSVFVGGCATVRSTDNTGTVAGSAIEGGKGFGNLEQLDKELERISERAKAELEAAGRSSANLGEILRTVFGIAFQLLDDIDSLRGETEHAKTHYKNTTYYISGMDIVEVC